MKELFQIKLAKISYINAYASQFVCYPKSSMKHATLQQQHI